MLGFFLALVMDPRRRFEQTRYLVKAVAGGMASKYSAWYRLSDLVHWGEIGLWDACTKWEGEDAQFEWYARTRIRGQIIDEMRHCSPYPRRMDRGNQPGLVNADDVVLEDLATPVDEVVDRSILLERAMARLCELTAREREVLRLYFVEGQRSVDIAGVLGVTEARVSQIKRAALEKLALGVDGRDVFTGGGRV